jgi:hypothetical protein
MINDYELVRMLHLNHSLLNLRDFVVMIDRHDVEHIMLVSMKHVVTEVNRITSTWIYHD